MNVRSNETPHTPLPDEQSELVAGGTNRSGDAKMQDLSCFIKKKVVNVSAGAVLSLRNSPGGPIVPGVGWQNSEPILVNIGYRRGNWIYAFKDGMFGFVNAYNVY